MFAEVLKFLSMLLEFLVLVLIFLNVVFEFLVVLLLVMFFVMFLLMTFLVLSGMMRMAWRMLISRRMRHCVANCTLNPDLLNFFVLEFFRDKKTLKKMTLEESLTQNFCSVHTFALMTHPKRKELKTLLRSYYNIEEEQLSPFTTKLENKVEDPLDIDSKNFDAKLYFKNLLKTKSLPELMKISNDFSKSNSLTHTHFHPQSSIFIFFY
jgi:hypothetical protein